MKLTLNNLGRLLLVSAIASLAMAQESAVVARGRAFLAAQAGIREGADLRVRSIRESASGETHIRFDRYYKGVRVFEGEGIAHVKGDAVSATNSLGGAIDLDVAPAITEAAARASVLRAYGLGADASLSSSLQVLMSGARSAQTALVWHVSVFNEGDSNPLAVEVFVNAKSGAFVWAYSNLQTADTTGTGNTMYVGQVPLDLDLTGGTYSMVAPAWFGIETRDANNRQIQALKGQIFTNTTGTFGNYQRDSSDRSTAGADAHYGMVETLKYFKTTFNRNGIDGNSRSSYNKVHFGRNYQNAFWSDSCFCMTFGDGGSTFLPLVSIDVAAHEMGHGVMSTEANLTYSGESGGLNESSSDIWGTVVETTVNNALDVPDFWIGERIYRSNWSGNTYTQTSALRYMDDPHKDGTSPACWSAGIGGIDVHYSSGPNNHFFYLFANGGTSKCNGAPVTGIGIVKAAAIWYDAITNRMTASTNYAGAKAAVVAAAQALYGVGSPEATSAAAAYAAINVN
jgi:Zn-dependent metalloprotease